MNRPRTIFAALLLGLLLAPASQLRAQSVVVTPGSPTVVVNKTVQFAAQVTGLPSADVIWAAGGTPGGSALAGNITPAGLYTAPATLPAQNPVQITAVSAADGTKKASVFVYLISQGPTITAVTPSPVAVGSLTVTVQGSGFLPGATVYDSYGSSGAVQLSTASVTATSVIANGYQGNASTAAFSVRNPGSDYSNTLTVPIAGAKAAAYVLTVVNGSGGGPYAAGKTATITANAPPAGQNFSGWTGAAVVNPGAPTTTLTMPAANVTVTANYTSGPPTYALNVVNGAGSGLYPAGQVVNITANAAPAGQMFINWTGASVASPSAAATTFTMSAASATVTANYAAVAVNIPYPVSSHPRLWVTPVDLPRLQSWATPGNPIYAQGIVPLLSQAVSVYNTYFFPNGVPNPNYPDPGDTQGYGYINNVGTSNTEEWAAILAFNSLIDPSAANRIMYAQDARNLLMVAMNQAALGHLAGAPFRDPMFAVYNRANGSGEEWPLTVDWIYNAVDAQGNPILTASDKLTIRNVFLMWANDCLSASTTGGDHPSPIGVTNSAQLLPGGKPYRMASNNYYLGHARLLTLMSLCIDPGDDPLVNASLPASQLGNTLRSYILDANGAWLYQEFAMMGDPSTVASAYGLPGSGTGFGLASGGLPPEGMLYGHSYAYILGQLLALQTAGFNDPTLAGPQIGLIGAPVWDRFVTGFLSSLTPTSKVFTAQPWLGPVYQYGSYGDLLRLWVTPDFVQPFSLLALLDGKNGSTAHLNAARWFAVNAVEGGSAGLLSRISSASAYGTTQQLLYFLLLDPALGPAVDPRPALPTIFVDPAAGRILAHSDWSAQGTLFDYRASWVSINHQLGDAGQFELFRHGEWLTKEMSNYDSNELGLTSLYHNTLTLQNWCANGTPNLNWYEGGEWANGSQWIIGLNAGDPVTLTSSGPGYVYANSNLTPLYNRPSVWTPANAATDITQATRSLLWLNNDYVVVYDRATSQHAGLFKRFNLSLVTNPLVANNVAAETLASGQQLFVQTLLPQSPSVTAAYAAGSLNPVAQLEPTQYLLTVEDPTRPADVRFLHVLQGADPGAAMVPASYLQSAGGTAFDGAVFGSTAVFFPVNSGVFTQTTLSCPASVHTLLVTGLAANAGYGVSIQSGGSGSVIVLTSGGASTNADGAGVVRLTF